MRKKLSTNIKFLLFWTLRITTLFTLIVALFFLSISLGFFGNLPSIREIKNPKLNLASEIISSDGVVIGKLGVENRTSVSYYQLPKHLINALIATEDERFFNHGGVDLRSTARAIFKPGTGGASTITQQLAKNLFTKDVSRSTTKRVFQKMKEWLIAAEIERNYTKKEIITIYLNNQDFVFNAVGIESAAKIYFGKDLKDLKVEESAVLVAMLKNPVLYNPNIKKFRENCLKRRNLVFYQMYRNNFITKKEKDSLQQLPLKITYSPETHYNGLATYFRSHVQKFMLAWVKEKKLIGKHYDLYRDGLKIYVTIDSRMQQHAEKALYRHLSNLQHHFNEEQKNNKTSPFYNLTSSEIKAIYNNAKVNSYRYKKLKKTGKTYSEIEKVFNTKTNMKVFSYKGEIDTIMSPMDSIKYYKTFLRSGLLSMEPGTGHVKAWVGGVDFKYFKYDAVAKQKRQVGSTFKPFVYATAIEKLNISPCHVYENKLFTIPKGRHGAKEDWTPNNADYSTGGFMDLKTAIAKSVNIISARLIDALSPEQVADFSYNLGIKNNIPITPSIALGTVDLTLLEMVNAYSTFANKGMRSNPIIITKIEDKHGNEIQRFKTEKKQVLSEESAYIILELLKGVIINGSASRLKSNWNSAGILNTGFPYEFQNSIAGKTGTTQNQSDGWFIGMVPNLVTGVWTGGEDRATHFYGIAKGQGATMALPTWAIFMKKCYEDKTLNISKKDFEKPENLSINIDCDSKSDENKDLVIPSDTDF